MKKLLSITFIILILGLPSRDLLVFAYFNINQSYIANFLCINKDKPNQECNGKCFLKIELNKQHENEDASFFNFEKINFNFYLAEFEQLPSFQIVFKDKNLTFYRKMNSSLFKPRIFEPPRHF